jgi:hypothetical protein
MVILARTRAAFGTRQRRRQVNFVPGRGVSDLNVAGYADWIRKYMPGQIAFHFWLGPYVGSKKGAEIFSE